ncbi:MAG: tRNA (adenosine(37)-N6)-threonylcarbamoyltransferase complex transferase subunit TsaD [Rickettsiaceae bacterium]|nr:tRNA (adenosine(37)-N6)-threonylcarbamoyltransferase complex transferase subunit TsaD [Rickettsiaceae bacterium]
MNILGLEASCDDTAAAVISAHYKGQDASGKLSFQQTDHKKILSNVVKTQNTEHISYKGIVPEIAARSHLHHIQSVIDQALSEAHLSFDKIDAIAATSGPGLIGGVIVGCMYGKTLASVLKKPFIAINHLEGHALTVKLTNEVEFPYLLLLISGGHCQFVSVNNLGNYTILGQTIDDAAGEAFDKVAKMMNLGFPGGPIIETLAQDGDSQKFNFPKPLYYQKDANMSFSGLKTAVSLQIQKISPYSKQDQCDIAASFQKTICDILTNKTKYAMYEYEKLHIGQPRTLVVAGGVAANKAIRINLEQLAQNNGYKFIAPPINLCTDNAAMIAFAGLLRLEKGIINSVSFKPRAKWDLEELKI